MTDKWNHIRNHSLLYHLLFTVAGIRKVLLDFLEYWLFLNLTVPTFNIFFIVKLFLTALNIFESIKYYLLYQLYFLFQLLLSFICSSLLYQSLSRICYSFLCSTPIRWVCLSATHISDISISVVVVLATPPSYACHLFT